MRTVLVALGLIGCAHAPPSERPPAPKPNPLPFRTFEIYEAHGRFDGTSIQYDCSAPAAPKTSLSCSAARDADELRER